MISIKLAKEISILKWEGELNLIPSVHLEIEKLYPNAHAYFYCGFCIRHEYSNFISDNHKCLNCEIGLSSAKYCLNDDSLYNKIVKAECGTEYPELVKELIEIIKNIPENE